jgi:hypothetical protein
MSGPDEPRHMRPHVRGDRAFQSVIGDSHPVG